MSVLPEGEVMVWVIEEKHRDIWKPTQAMSLTRDDARFRLREMRLINSARKYRIRSYYRVVRVKPGVKP